MKKKTSNKPLTEQDITRINMECIESYPWDRDHVERDFNAFARAMHFPRYSLNLKGNMLFLNGKQYILQNGNHYNYLYFRQI